MAPDFAANACSKSLTRNLLDDVKQCRSDGLEPLLRQLNLSPPFGS
jgi:hypothetical protein